MKQKFSLVVAVAAVVGVAAVAVAAVAVAAGVAAVVALTSLDLRQRMCEKERRISEKVEESFFVAATSEQSDIHYDDIFSQKLSKILVNLFYSNLLIDSLDCPIDKWVSGGGSSGRASESLWVQIPLENKLSRS